MITNSLRQGLLILFGIMMVFIGKLFLGMSYFEILLLVGIAAIVTKLTDIEEKL
jgi:hypothetical protein